MNSEKFYRQFILEASRSQKHRGKIESGLKFEGNNPSCGDELTLYLQIEQNKILDAKFEGSGCAISMASAHFLCENIIGRAVSSAEKYVAGYLESIDAGAPNSVYAPLDGVAQMPARAKCARLAWGTINKAAK